MLFCQNLHGHFFQVEKNGREQEEEGRVFRKVGKSKPPESRSYANFSPRFKQFLNDFQNLAVYSPLYCFEASNSG